MKTLPGAMVFIVSVASAAFAKDDLGPFADAQKAWPDAFVPGKVATVDFAGEALYAFAGEAESFFPGEFAESDAELREEAVLDAKATFFAVMTEGDPTRSVTLSGLRVAYRWRDGSKFYVVCVVPRQAARVSPPVASVSVPAPPAPTAATPATPSPSATSVNVGGCLPLRDDPPSAIPVKKDASADDRVQVLRKKLADNPEAPLPRLELARVFAKNGESGRAARHYAALVRTLVGHPDSMPKHDAVAAIVEAAEFTKGTGDEAQALKFYRAAAKYFDPELQPRITAAISLLRLHVD